MLRLHECEVELGDDERFYYRELPFTGVVYDIADDGQLLFEAELRSGRMHGVSRTWTPEGNLVRERHFRNGLLHGRQRHWHLNGPLLLREDEFELGVCVRSREWDVRRRLLRDYLIELRPHQLELLALARAALQDDGAK